VLIGRAPELSRLSLLIDAAQIGRSSALIVHGDPGIGKTSLLKQAARRAEGFRVLRARPLQAESELPFAGLSELLGPILELRERIPGPQQVALAGALALGPAVGGDRFAVAAATLSVLAAAAEDAPVLVVVDDAHWLDDPSRVSLIFAARRLGSEGIVVLFGMRDREWLADTGLETLRLDGLAADAAGVLIDQTEVTLDVTVRDRLVTETRGNPLAIIEAVSTLTEDERRGRVPIGHPLAVGATLERAFAQHLEDLPDVTRRALVIAAASDTGDAREILAAMAGEGLSAQTLEAAERAEMITLSRGRVEFRHPLVRSAAYHARDPAGRRDAHRALAAAVGGDDQGAWHLAAAAAGPDEEVAAMLEASATRALGRSAYGAAARALEAAATLSPDDAGRLRRTIQAGRALWLGGEPARAARILETAAELARDPVVRAQVQHLRAQAMFFTYPVAETHAMLVAEAGRVADQDPLLAAQMLCTASNVSVMAGEVERAEQMAREAMRAVGDHQGPSAIMAKLTLGGSSALRGNVADGLRMIEPVLAGERERLMDPMSELASSLFAVIPILTWTDRREMARGMLESIIAGARAAGAVTGLPFWLAGLSELELREGRITPAYAAASESVQLASDTGQATELTFSLVTLARLDAILGNEAECRGLVSTALDSARRTGTGSIETYASSVLGLLELSLGRPDRAVAHLLTCDRLRDVHGTGLLAVVHWAGDLIDAQVRTDDLDGARVTVDMVQASAGRTGVRWELSIAARGRAMLAAEGNYEGEFERALALHGNDSRYERARTLLALGMRRRRSRRRADARTVLREALAYFETSGALPWAEQARVELRAAGETVPSGESRPQSLHTLTPQELQVALTVAAGATNKEAAAALFLSTKTVEFHLGNAYRKLNLRSRAELVRKVAGLS
jgi:DNA-binding CsgD family transcriptional regulator